MAHAKSEDYRDRVLYLSAHGMRSRNVSSVNYIVAGARTNNTAPNRIMADIIQNETEVFPIFTAPCACRVLRTYANGTPFVDMGAGGSVTATTYKSAATALDGGIAVGAATVPTANTAIDGTLVGGTTMDLTEGQHVYVSVAVSNHTVDTAVAYLTHNVEWVPTEQ